jgi:hypothetical protein
MWLLQWARCASNELGRGGNAPGVPQLGFIKLNLRVQPFVAIVLAISQTQVEFAHYGVKI